MNSGLWVFKAHVFNHYGTLSLTHTQHLPTHVCLYPSVLLPPFVQPFIISIPYPSICLSFHTRPSTHLTHTHTPQAMMYFHPGPKLCPSPVSVRAPRWAAPSAVPSCPSCCPGESPAQLLLVALSLLALPPSSRLGLPLKELYLSSRDDQPQAR